MDIAFKGLSAHNWIRLTSKGRMAAELLQDLRAVIGHSSRTSSSPTLGVPLLLCGDCATQTHGNQPRMCLSFVKWERATEQRAWERSASCESGPLWPGRSEKEDKTGSRGPGSDSVNAPGAPVSHGACLHVPSTELLTQRTSERGRGGRGRGRGEGRSHPQASVCTSQDY